MTGCTTCILAKALGIKAGERIEIHGCQRDVSVSPALHSQLTSYCPTGAVNVVILGSVHGQLKRLSKYR